MTGAPLPPPAPRGRRAAPGLTHSADLEARKDASSERGVFLRSRRPALPPEEVGIPPSPPRRRVAGLRREELAMLANVSIPHYPRLEQGRAGSASDGLLE